MKVNKILVFILLLVAGAVAYYFLSTDRKKDAVLIGIVDANQVIVSSKVMGRVEKLYVDEGSKTKQFEVDCPMDLMQNLLWFQQLRDLDDANHLRADAEEGA